MRNLTLQIGGQAISGWVSATVTCSIERIPRSFELVVVRDVNDQFVAGTRAIAAGTPCTLFANGTSDRLVTGYIDAVDDQMSAGEHTIRYQGRGASQDIVDSSAEFWGGNTGNIFGNELTGISILTGITRIAAGYDVQVVNENPNTSIMNQNPLTINLGQSAYDGLEYFNKQAGALLYENENGALVLGSPGSAGTSRTVLNHQRCIASQVLNDLTGVYTDTQIYVQAAATDWPNFDKAHVGSYHNSVFDGKPTANGGVNVANPPAKRNRKLKRVVDIVLSPQIYAAGSNPQQVYANWIGNRMAGLSQKITVSVVGWYDDAGELWRINRLVGVQLERQWILSGTAAAPQPVILLIAEVTYEISPDGGTICTMMLAPAAAFAPDLVEIPVMAAQAALLASQNNQPGMTPPAAQTGPGGLQGHT